MHQKRREGSTDFYGRCILQGRRYGRSERDLEKRNGSCVAERKETAHLSTRENGSVSTKKWRDKEIRSFESSGNGMKSRGRERKTARE